MSSSSASGSQLLAGYQQPSAAAPTSQAPVGAQPSWFAQRASGGGASSSAAPSPMDRMPGATSSMGSGAAPALVADGYASAAAAVGDGFVGAKEYRCMRTFYGSVEGSMVDFAANPAKARWSLTNEYALKYRMSDTPEGGPRVGDPTKTVIFSAKVVMVRNTLPVDVMLGSNILRGNCYSNKPGQRGFLVAAANKTVVYKKPFQVYYHNRSIYSKVMSVYSGLTEDHLNQAKPLPNATTGEIDHYMVPAHAPEVRILARNQQNKQDPFVLSTMRVGAQAQWYMVPTRYYTSARRALKEKVLTQLPYKSLHGLNIVVLRPDTDDWQDNRGLYQYLGGASTQLCERAKRTRGIVSWAIQVEYRNYGMPSAGRS